eukprot:3283638-Amphidinium_carterae.1
MLSSAPEFLARAREMGLEEDYVQRLIVKGWDTYAKYAFSSAYTPGTSNEEPFINNVVIPILGDAQHRQIPILRWLVFETYYYVSSDTGVKSKRTSDDAPQKLPHADRVARMIRLKKRFFGRPLEGPYEPAHHLIDL